MTALLLPAGIFVPDTRDRLPDDFVKQNIDESLPRPEDVVYNIVLTAFEYWRPEILHVEMGWNLEERIHKIFDNVHEQLPPYYRSKMAWYIQKVRPCVWRCNEPLLTWNVILNSKLVVSFNT